MPASVRISDSEILVVVRRREGPRRWLAAYLSQDNGETWTPLDDPVSDTGEGNPPALVKLRDGRICLIYGYRAKPFSIRAKLSNDNGRTWSHDIVLRDDGGDRDIGYPRVVQRPDGKVIAVYYFNDPKTGPERYIGATIWDPELTGEP
jgi:Neuraminidase (sialidase)